MKIENIIFKPQRTHLTVTVEPPLTKTANLPDFPEAILEALPALRTHICYNDDGFDLCKELEDTELAHVLEHVIIEIIAQKDISAQNVKGWTEWNWQLHPRWTYEVVVEYDNQKIFLEALDDALRILSQVLDGVNTNVLTSSLPQNYELQVTPVSGV